MNYFIIHLFVNIPIVELLLLKSILQPNSFEKQQQKMASNYFKINNIAHKPTI